MTPDESRLLAYIARKVAKLSDERHLLAELRAEVQERRDTVHALEPGGPGGGAIGDASFAQCQAFTGVLKLIDAKLAKRNGGDQ